MLQNCGDVAIRTRVASGQVVARSAIPDPRREHEMTLERNLIQVAHSDAQNSLCLQGNIEFSQPCKKSAQRQLVSN